MMLSLRIPPTFRRILSPLVDPWLPSFALEIGEGYAAAAELTAGSGPRGLRSFFLAEIPAPSPAVMAVAGSSLLVPPEFGERVAALAARAGIGPQKASLVIPDCAARVAILALDSVPRSRADVESVVRWRLKKSIPFRPEEAIVDYIQFPPDNGSGRHTVLAALIRRRIVEQVEAACSSLGFPVGLVNLSTFAVYNLFASRIAREIPPGGDVALLNVALRSFGLIILRGDRPIFYRAKSLGHLAAGGRSAILHAIESELNPSLQYYRSRLEGTGIAALYLRPPEEDAEGFAATLTRSLGVPVHILDARDAVQVPAGLDPGPAVTTRLAPAIGLALGAAS